MLFKVREMHHDAQSLPHQIFDFNEPPEKRIQIIKIRKIQKFKRTKYWFREVDSFRAPQRLNYILEKMTTETRFRANSLTSNGSSRPSTPNGSILYDLLTQKETRKTTKVMKIGWFSKMTVSKLLYNIVIYITKNHNEINTAFPTSIIKRRWRFFTF